MRLCLKQGSLNVEQHAGVMDDRGKYIYVSRSEMEAVARFICQKGRIRIAELAERSSELIDLEPKVCHSHEHWWHVGTHIDGSEFVAGRICRGRWTGAEHICRSRSSCSGVTKQLMPR